MVYYGVSRGCTTCKRRRKKVSCPADDILTSFYPKLILSSVMRLVRCAQMPAPLRYLVLNKLQACNRCTKTKLTCSGYEDEGDLIFRHYSAATDRVVSVTLPAAKSQDLRVYSPSNDAQLHVTDEESIGEFALAAFFADFCFTTNAPLLSRGYLAGLKELLARLDPLSDVSRAARAAAFASLGNKLKDSNLTRRASLTYSNLLQSFQVTMSRKETANTIESLTTAVLLGLYEVYLS